MPGEIDELSTIQIDLRPEPREIFLDDVYRKFIVSCRYWSVGGKYIAPGYDPGGFLEGLTGFG